MTIADQPFATGLRARGGPPRRTRRLRAAVLAGLFLVLAGLLPLPPAIGAALLGAGTALATMGAVWLLRDSGALHRRADARALVRDVIAADPVVSVLTDGDGAVLEINGAAQRRLQRDTGQQAAARVDDVLRLMLAEPGGVVRRMAGQASETGVATETIVTRRGRVRLSAHDTGSDLLLWRVEEAHEPERDRVGGAAALPQVTAGRTGAVLYMNDAARALFGKRATRLSDLSEAPLTAGAVVTIPPAAETEAGGAPAPRRCLVVSLAAGSGRRELFFLPAEAALAARSEPPSGFDALPVPLLEMTHDGRILRANGEALRLLERTSVTDSRLGDLLEGLGRPVADWLSDVASGRTQGTSEFLRITGALSERFIQVTLKPMHAGAEPHVLAVLSDATELKTLEAQFVQSQKMQAIGQLAGGVAHDFNNLLTAISGHCDLLLLRHDQGDPDYGDLVQINQNANRAAALVSQLLAFSRKQTLRPELLDLRDTLSDLTHLLNRLVGEKVRLRLSHDDDLRPVRVDKRQLEQVMMNLVVNARDARPEGGRIEIATDVVHLRSPLKRDRAVVAPGEYVSVKVTDQGTGIAPDKLQKVFEPFYTTKRAGEGTGLGLSTVYGIVKQTGGFIFVDSVLGQGTCFTLMFPVHDEAPLPVVEAPAEPAAQVSERSDAVVLLVEDEAPVRAFASRALRLRGFTVLEAQSAEEALERLEDPALKIDVFVTDVVMPGMDGPRWVREALKARPDTRVVFVSGYAEESLGADQMRIPNSVFLPKPFSLSELTETVQRQLH